MLKPGGRIAVAYNTRDDTVPWVKRLMAHDPRRPTRRPCRATTACTRSTRSPTARTSPVWSAATSATGSPSPDRLCWRWWSAARAPARLDQPTRQALLTEVGELYDTVARPPEPLLLPFQASCWRAVVDHSQLAISEDPDAVEIKF